MSKSQLKTILQFVDFFDHQRVWNSIDNEWAHPSYCVTCRNIEIIKNHVD